MSKLTKKIKKAGKDAVKQTEKVVDKTTSPIVDYAGKKYNQATGAMEGVLDKAIDYGHEQFHTALEYTEKTWNEGTEWIEDLAEDAIEAAYREIYQKYVGDYVRFVGALAEAQFRIFVKPDNILTRIRDNLFAGKFSTSVDGVKELLASDEMKKAVDAGHSLFGTSFIVVADLGFGASKGLVTGGVTGTIGITYMMDHYQSYEYETCVFSALGGAIGATTPTPKLTGSVAVGIAMGFLAKDPTNIGGWFVDVSGAGTLENGIFSLGMSWSPPGSKPPYVKATPVSGTARVALTGSYDGTPKSSQSAEPSASGSLTIGGSYTWILQKIKNDLYMG